MDVRCDRCQTEYELEDASVADGGASVQCTTCGHTFVVSRARNLPTPTPPPVPTDTSGPPSWMLTTEEGKAHRFRDPTTLQKWIVERRVGRADKVCPPGGSWRRLGDMDELRPFFEVVDQADRTAAAARGARPTTPETPGRRSAPRPAPESYASIDDDDDDVLTSGRRSGNGRGSAMQGRVSGRLDSEITAGIGRAGDGDDDSLSLVLPARRTGPKVVVGLLILGLMGAAGYYSYHGGFGSHRGSEAVASTPSPAPVAPRALPASPPAAAPVAAAAPVPTPPPAPTAPAAAVAPPAAAPAPSPPPAPAPTAAAVPAPAPAASPAAEEASASSVGASGRRGPVHAAGPGAAEISGRGHSYEQLVADGDRALENGNTAKAQKMFDEALRLQPDGVAAVTGSGYLLLDRQKPLAAIGMFKRALASAPSFPQALFGLGEAYRSQGNPGEAIDAYRKYLSVAPGGPDAPAARRQVRELESAAAPARHAVTSPPEGAAPLPIAPPPN